MSLPPLLFPSLSYCNEQQGTRVLSVFSDSVSSCHDATGIILSLGNSCLLDLADASLWCLPVSQETSLAQRLTSKELKLYVFSRVQNLLCRHLSHPA